MIIFTHLKATASSITSHNETDLYSVAIIQQLSTFNSALATLGTIWNNGTLASKSKRLKVNFQVKDT